MWKTGGRNPKGADAAGAASAGMLPVSLGGQHDSPGSAGACQQAAKQGKESSGPFLFGTDAVQSWISAVMKAERTQPARILWRPTSAHAAPFATQVVLLSPKYPFPYLCWPKGGTKWEPAATCLLHSHPGFARWERRGKDFEKGF